MTATLTAPSPSATATGPFHVTAARSDLLAAIGRVSDTTPAKTTLPVLACVLLTPVDGGLTLAATDLDRWTETRLACVASGSPVAIPAKRFRDVVNALPAGQPVTLEAKSPSVVVVKAGRSRFEVATFDASEWPNPNWRGDKQRATATVAASDFLATLALCARFASEEASRPILCGVLVQASEGAVTLVGTDGYTLARRVLASDALAAWPDVIVPKDAAQALAKLFAKDASLSLIVQDNALVVTGAEATLSTRLIEGPFPKVDPIIRATDAVTATLDRQAFAEAVSRVATVTEGDTRRVELTWQADGVTLTAEHAGQRAEDVVACTFTGTPGFRTAANALLLTRALGAITDETLTLGFGETPNRAMQLRTATDAPADATLVMPLAIRD